MNEEFVDCRCCRCGRGIRVLITVSQSKSAMCKSCKEKYAFVTKLNTDTESRFTNKHGVIY